MIPGRGDKCRPLVVYVFIVSELYCIQVYTSLTSGNILIQFNYVAGHPRAAIGKDNMFSYELWLL